MRTDAQEIYIRETRYGPEIVLDYGVQGTAVPVTETDLDKLTDLLIERREVSTALREGRR